MTAHLIHPSLTVGESPIAIEFYEVCQDELSQHVQISPIRNEMVLKSVKLSKDDTIVFFNRNDQNYSPSFVSLLKDLYEVKNVEEIKNDVFPIAIESDMRTPPELISSIQSFDLIDQLRRRSLDIEYIPLIATTISRTIISRMQPTLSKDNMKLFLSHRRLDGEEIAANFYREFKARAENVFRDLIDIRVGEDAQEVIEENLRASDAVIFLDTPRVGESKWVEKELNMALSLNLPIVWVKIGADESRIQINTRPADKPHFIYSDLEELERKIEPSLIDEIINRAFNITRNYAQSVFDHMNRLKSLASEKGIEMTEVDQRNMIFQISIPRKGFKYFQRPMTHLIQFMGRFPHKNDLDSFIPAIEKLGYTNSIIGPIYDTPILLGPIPGQVSQEQSNCVVDSFDEYINTIQNLYEKPQARSGQKKGLIISGAFPDCEPEYQQHLTDAIYCFSEAIFNKSGEIIFGAHPTFQHLIFDMGKRKIPFNYRDVIHLYISKYFVTEPSLKEYSKSATVNATDIVDGDRDKSLSLMRQRMISDERAIALIALGGKTDRDGHVPGIDEEIELAKKAGIPVFIIGSVGGRTSQLSAEYKKRNWVDIPNNLSKSENNELMLSKDYSSIANKILSHLNF